MHACGLKDNCLQFALCMPAIAVTHSERQRAGCHTRIGNYRMTCTSEVERWEQGWNFNLADMARSNGELKPVAPYGASLYYPSRSVTYFETRNPSPLKQLAPSVRNEQ